ncbi:hypothetical protein [uncultured Winogradskyella sp.]|uniref:hypothetical protein n=1 Tax=uncultured Winogradskyella sp. TaxID=395353 RepID=UPI002618DC4E|nr:hypothetical protein [uncultured Winogradskyella sp.]
MKYYLTFIFLCLFINVTSQQGVNYLKLMERLVLVDSSDIKKCFKNGKPKECGSIKYYEHKDYVYEMKVGTFKRFHRDGSSSFYYFDKWGTDLLTHHYDADDNLVMEWTTTKIETTAATLDEFFDSRDHITYNVSFKDYSYDFKDCKYYLRKEGHYSNGKKSGLWKFYLSTRELQKSKQY